MSVYTSKYYQYAKEHCIHLDVHSLEDLKAAAIKFFEDTGHWAGTKVLAAFCGMHERTLKQHLSLFNISSFSDFQELIGNTSYHIWTESEILEKLRLFLNSSDDCTGPRFYREFGITEKVVLRVLRVKNWASAVRKIGGKNIHTELRNDPSIYLKELYDLYIELGRCPSWKDFQTRTAHNARCFRNRFGSFTEGLLAAGIPENEIIGSKGFTIPFERVLSSLGSVKKEVTFNDLRSDSNHPLRFDYSLSYKGESILIELDGWSHFNKSLYIKFFHTTEENYNLQRSYDVKKETYCKSHDYKLIRFKVQESFTVDHIKMRLDLLFSNGEDPYRYFIAETHDAQEK